MSPQYFTSHFTSISTCQTSWKKYIQIKIRYVSTVYYQITHIFRWFKFTLKPTNSMAHGNFFLAIWDTFHWNFFVKFGLKTPYDISQDPSWSILTYVNFWRLQGHLSNLPKKDAFRKSIFSQWRSDRASKCLRVCKWADT